MMMGLISFAFYVAAEAYNFPSNDWYTVIFNFGSLIVIWYDRFKAFDFAHLVVLFIGITFLFQSVLLASLISSRNLTLLRYSTTTSEELIREYVGMYKQGGFRMAMFNYGLVSLSFPVLREKIEFKILQHFFIKVYNLPIEFKFANYMCWALKKYIIALVEVRPISWLVMSGFVALNFLKMVVIDSKYQSEACRKYLKENHVGDGHDCNEFTLRYACLVLLLIGFFLVGVLIASEIYMKRLTEIVLNQQCSEIDEEKCKLHAEAPLKVRNDKSINFLDYLEHLMNMESNHRLMQARRMSQDFSAVSHASITDPALTNRHDDALVRSQVDLNDSSQCLDGEQIRERFQRMQLMGTDLRESHYLANATRSEDRQGALSRKRGYSVDFFSTDMHSDEVTANSVNSNRNSLAQGLNSMSCCLLRGFKWLGCGIVQHLFRKSAHVHNDVDEDILKVQKELNRIFLCGQSEWYYYSVEVALLMQCIYIALWATNFVQMAQNSHNRVLWHMLLVMPLPFYFWILKQLIFISCMLKSILSLDKFICDKICDEALEEQYVVQRLRKTIRNELKKITPDLTTEDAKEFLRGKFAFFANESDYEGVNEKRFKLFLHSFQIFLTDASISRIFSVIDFDRDGYVTWNDMNVIVLPDFRQETVKVSRRESTRLLGRVSLRIEHEEVQNLSDTNKDIGILSFSAGQMFANIEDNRPETVAGVANDEGKNSDNSAEFESVSRKVGDEEKMEFEDEFHTNQKECIVLNVSGSFDSNSAFDI
jgi:hypothetical protein